MGCVAGPSADSFLPTLALALFDRLDLALSARLRSGPFHPARTSLSETYQASSQVSIDAGIYDEVFNADVEPMSLEEMFTRFNTVMHPLYRGRSMSVSDVVVIDPERCQRGRFSLTPKMIIHENRPR